MTIDINAARAELTQLERSHRYSGGMEVVAFAARLLDEIARLTDSEDSRVVVLEAENRRLKVDAERAKPVLDAAQAFRRVQDSLQSGWTWAEYHAKLDAFAAAVDGHDAAGHTRKPSEVDGCVCSFTNHDYNGTTVKELNPDADCPIHGEVVCPRCGGRDGTHTFRDCKTAARYPHAKCADEEPHNSHVWGDPEHWCAGTWTTTAVVAEAALLRQELGLSSTDTTAVERG